MKRVNEFNKIKHIIKKTIKNYNYGLFNTRNLVGDSMETLYKGKYFTLDACYNWSYYEVFGMNDDEFSLLKDFYDDLCMKLD